MTRFYFTQGPLLRHDVLDKCLNLFPSCGKYANTWNDGCTQIPLEIPRLSDCVEVQDITSDLTVAYTGEALCVYMHVHLFVRLCVRLWSAFLCLSHAFRICAYDSWYMYAIVRACVRAFALKYTCLCVCALVCVCVHAWLRVSSHPRLT